VSSNWQVIWDRKVQKQLDRIPTHVRDKFLAWAIVVEQLGLERARRIPGYHDEPLTGRLKGKRSIRLNRAYRAIYIEEMDGNMQIVEIVKVSKHEYQE